MHIAVVGTDTLAQAVAVNCGRQPGWTVTREATAAADVRWDVLWVCYDTPTGADHAPCVAQVCEWIARDVQVCGPDCIVVVSSQLPVGTVAALEHDFPCNVFVACPENVRAKTAVEDFARQARIVVGVRTGSARVRGTIERLLFPFTGRLIWTDPETAEMVKHALNGMLALTIAYANEFGAICDAVGADGRVVAEAIRADVRFGPLCPVVPGAPYGGGHLEREVYNLNRLAELHRLDLPLVANVARSNAVGGRHWERDPARRV